MKTRSPAVWLPFQRSQVTEQTIVKWPNPVSIELLEVNTLENLLGHCVPQKVVAVEAALK